MIKIFSIFGTRPEAIKMAMLCKSLSDLPNVEHKIVSTGQHREMLKGVFEFFEILPDYDLDIMRGGQDLTDITTNVLGKLRKLFKEDRPDLILVHGDTTTSMAASLASFYERIDVGHVEAGLRTNNIYSPYPEELNRSIISKIAKFHFAPTDAARLNLIKEGVCDNIVVTGNTVIDSLMYSANLIDDLSFSVQNNSLNKVIKSPGRLILITGHRRENFGQGFIEICEAILHLAKSNPDFSFVYPVHLNPNVQSPVMSKLSGVANIILCEPLDYKDFIFLLKRSFLILTDSGGVQEEAPSLKKPVLVMRSNTERPEAIAAGTAKLVGASRDSIINGVQELINNEELYTAMVSSRNPYGDGNASSRIIDYIREFYNLNN